MVARRIMSRINEPIGFQGATILPGASAGIAVLSGGRRQRQRPCRACRPCPLFGQEAGRRRVFLLLRGAAARTRAPQAARTRPQHRHRVKSPSRSISSRRSRSPAALSPASRRWCAGSMPTRGMISPGEFIPVARKSGLMAEIGRVVIAKAIAAAAEWHRAGIHFGRLRGQRVRHGTARNRLRQIPLRHARSRTACRRRSCRWRSSNPSSSTTRRPASPPSCAISVPAGVHLELDDFGTGYARSATSTRTRSTG